MTQADPPPKRANTHPSAAKLRTLKAQRNAAAVEPKGGLLGGPVPGSGKRKLQ